MRLSVWKTVITAVLSVACLKAGVPSQDMGRATVQPSQPNVQTITFSVPASSSFSLAFGRDYRVQSHSCSSGTCSVDVAFAPLYPGLRQDAVLAKDGSGNLLATTFLHGIGLGPQVSFHPGVITTVAGTGAWGDSGDGGAAISATFASPQGLAVDPVGNIYIADTVNQTVRKVDTNGLITTVAGNGVAGFSGDGSLATAAELNSPIAVALDPAGNVYIADSENNRVREVNALTGIISTVAGNGSAGTPGQLVGDGGAATAAILWGPADVCVSPAGELYIADTYNGLVRKVGTDGIIWTVAGGGSATGSDGVGDNGPATAAPLASPSGVALDPLGNLYISDRGHDLVRMVSNGIITAYATAPNAYGLRLDAAGDLYVADYGNSVIREFLSGQNSNAIIAGSDAIANPAAIALDGTGNLYIADSGTNRVRKVAFSLQNMAFGSTYADQASTPQTQSLFNAGNQTLSISALSISSGFSQQASGGTDCAVASSVAEGTDCILALALTSSTPGSVSGTLSITTSSLSASAVLSGTVLAAAGSIQASAAQLAFGHQGTGTTSAPQTITITNTGATTLTEQSITLGGTNASAFSFGAIQCGQTLAGGAHCTMQVSFAPTSTGNVTASVTVAYAGASIVAVTLTGTGDAPQVTLSSNALNFTATGQAQTLTVTNPSNAVLSISSISLSNAIDFATGSTTCGATLPPIASCTISITFAPSSSGTASGSLMLTDSAGSQSVALSGTKQQQQQSSPVLQLTPLQLIFATQGIGASSSPQTITVTNTGASAVTNPAIIFTGAAAFTIASNSCASTLNANARCTLGITFTPSTAGSSSAAVTVSYSGAAAPVSAALSGTGVTAQASISPTSLAFATTPQGSVTAPQNVTLTNTGAVVLAISSITLSNNSDFAISTNSCAASLQPNASCTISVRFTPAGAGSRSGSLVITGSMASSLSVGLSGTGMPALEFIPITPCRLVDTRKPNGPWGGPAIAGQTSRDFAIPTSTCNIPAAAAAYALNVAVVPHGPLGYLTMWPTGQTRPFVATINSDGRIKANAAIVPAGTNGAISIFGSNTTDVVLDINGYFAPKGTPNALAFYPIAPCRVADTRNADGPLGELSAGKSRDFPVLASPCSVPATAKAYSLNFTAVPTSTLAYLTTWPAGQARPTTSTLNAVTGTVTANANIAPAGENGDISVFASNDTNLIIDVNGYFAPDGPGGYAYFNLTPCRVIDTRHNNGQPIVNDLTIDVAGSSCNTPAAQAYNINATVVPPHSLGYITLWPYSQTQPFVSTLNAADGAVTSNLAIVPAYQGKLSFFANNPTHLIVDLFGFFQ